MTQQAYIWAIAGFMAGMVVAFVALRLRPGSGAVLQRVNGWWLATALVFLLGAVAIYSKVARPQFTPATTTLMDALPGHATTVAAASSAGAIADVTAKLAAKLAKGEGTDADWQLLQQSYAFMGDNDAAALAAQHKLSGAVAAAMTGVVNNVPVGQATASSTAFDAKANSDAARYQQKVAANPRDAASWRNLAEAYRSARQFQQANVAFAELIKLKAMDADAWADYADSSASQSGSLANAQTRAALAAALKLNANHPKTLWLQASLQLEEKHYAQALKTWQQLRSVIADDSSDAKIIDANIAEAKSLSASSVGLLAGKAGS